MTPSSQDRRTVVVTGLGASTPVGGDVATTWEGLLAGRSGVRRLDAEWADALPVRIAATVAVEPSEVMDRVEARRLDRTEQLALIAAREAWADAGSPEVDGLRLGVAIGTGIGGAHSLLGQWEVLREKGPRRVSPHTIPMLMPNGPAAYVGLEVGAKAGVHTPVSACASGAEAVAFGTEMIRSGRADVVLVGGTESCVHPLPLAAFAAMMALSKREDEPERASRPYDKGRDGFVFGEGAGILVLEDCRARSSPRGSGLRRGRGCGHHLGRAPHRPAGPGRRRRGPSHDVRDGRRLRLPGRHRPPQRPRHLDAPG